MPYRISYFQKNKLSSQRLLRLNCSSFYYLSQAQVWFQMKHKVNSTKLTRQMKNKALIFGSCDVDIPLVLPFTEKQQVKQMIGQTGKTQQKWWAKCLISLNQQHCGRFVLNIKDHAHSGLSSVSSHTCCGFPALQNVTSVCRSPSSQTHIIVSDISHDSTSSWLDTCC